MEGVFKYIIRIADHPLFVSFATFRLVLRCSNNRVRNPMGHLFEMNRVDSFRMSLILQGHMQSLPVFLFVAAFPLCFLKAITAQALPEVQRPAASGAGFFSGACLYVTSLYNLACSSSCLFRMQTQFESGSDSPMLLYSSFRLN